MGSKFRTLGEKFIQRTPLILMSGLLLLLTEWLSRARLMEPITWGFKHIPELLIGGLFIICLFLIFIALIGRTRIAYWSFALILFIFSLVSGIKMKILGVPFLPWDFALSGEGGDMVKYLSNLFDVRILVGILLFAGISYFMMYRTPLIKKKVVWKERGIMAVLALALLAIMYTDQPVPIKKWLGVESMPWDQADNVKTNGFALATIINTKLLFSQPKAGYSDKTIEAILDLSTKKVEAGSGKKPNVIVVLSEAFWDPTLIKGAKFSRDPIPFFHKMQENYTSGWFLTPQYGGGTANVEFEVLTGNSMRFLPQGSVPYNQFITHEVDSMASILTRDGYTSTAINPFYSWFFNSKKVYENFGFSKFIPIEYMKPDYEGPYIADREVTAHIIDESKKTAGPDFIFANTMENHFHFYPGKFPKNTIDVTGDFSAGSKGMLETLAQGLQGADHMLQDLVEHYSKVDEPTIILFFGDHLPALGDDYEVYKDTKYISGPEDPEFLNKMFRTPYVVWNNFLPESPQKMDMSPSFMSPYLLDLAKQQGNYYTDFLAELYKKVPLIPPKNYYGAMNIKEEDLKDYETLQYDILFGDRHGYKDYKTPIIDKNYVLGLGPMQIIEASVDKHDLSGQSEVQISVSGTNLPPLGVVFLNGKPLPTTWVDEQTLTAKVTGNLLKPGIWDVQVKVTDSKDFVIGKTNSWPIEVGGR
jgi:phosphoglycerol transferase MdoB-like AlkP superfamily enzyme